MGWGRWNGIKVKVQPATEIIGLPKYLFVGILRKGLFQLVPFK